MRRFQRCGFRAVDPFLTLEHFDPAVQFRAIADRFTPQQKRPDDSMMKNLNGNLEGRKCRHRIHDHFQCFIVNGRFMSPETEFR